MTSENLDPDRSGATPDGAAKPEPPHAGQRSAQRAEALERLLDLAYDVSSYLRHRAQPTIRVSAALLLAASLAACQASGPSTTTAPGVAPLTQEISSGLPGQPGTYPIRPETLMRDQQGVYHFSWLQPGGSGPGTPAAVSLLKLAQADTASLVIPQGGGDPVLNITQNTPIQLMGVNNATPTTQRGNDYVYWRPFYGGGYYYGPRYYDPPSQTVNTGGGTTVDGSKSSTAPPPAAARTVAGAARAVSGRAGGTGSGNAATNKSGAVGGSSASGGGKGNAAAPSSGGFSAGGKSGASGGGSTGSSSS